MARRISVQLVGDSRSLERAFDRANRKGKEFDTTLGRAGSSLKTWGKAGAAGLAAGGIAVVTSQLFKSVSAAKEAEVAEARLRQALASAGKSHQRYGKQIDAVIQKTSKLAAIDDEELSDSFAKLVRTTGSVAKATKGMALAADIARARNISLETATKAVERALAGNESAFSRLGIQSNKNKDATDELTKAQQRFGGAAERYGKTSVAAQEKLAIAWENVQEKLGQKLLPAMVKVSEALVRLIEWGERNWPRFSKFVEDAWARIKPVFDAFKTYFGGWVKIIQGVVQGDWSLAWKGLKQIVAGAFELLFAYLRAVPARLFAFGVRMGKQLAAGVLEGMGNLAQDIGNALLPGNPIGGGTATPGPGSRGGRARPPKTPTTTDVYGGPRARGGSALAGRTYTVGEHGPELLRMGSSSGYVLPGGGGIHIGTLVLPGVQDALGFVSEMQRMARSTNAARRGPNAGTKLATT